MLLSESVLTYSDIPLLSGLIMSIVHVVSGPDHLAAVMPLAIESKRKSWSVGFAWGIGHTVGMLIIGVIFIILKENIDVDVISRHGEKIVGFLLIAIGVWAIWRAVLNHRKHRHVHPHAHGDEVHIHTHDHDAPEVHQHTHKKTHRQNVFSALGIGIIHGVAGVSHLIAILPTLALPSKMASIMYLSGFGVGTIVAMVSFAFTLGIIAHKSEHGNRKLFIFLRIFGGSLAIGVGIWWIVMSLFI